MFHPSQKGNECANPANQNGYEDQFFLRFTVEGVLWNNKVSFDDIVADIRAFLLLVLGSSFLLFGFEMGLAQRCDAGWASRSGPPKFTR